MYSDVKELLSKTSMEFQNEFSKFKLLAFTSKLKLQNAFEELNSIWNKKEIQQAYSQYSNDLNLNDYTK
jgi:archaellum component FlaC